MHPDPAPEMAPARPDRPADDQGSNSHYKEQLVSAFDTEKPDPSWSARTENLIESVVHEPGFKGTRLGVARCATTFCRVELEHDTTLLQHDHLTRLLMKPPFAAGGTVFQSKSDAGLPTTSIFFARQGARLPPPAESSL
jgi:hypothetical protein